MRVLLSAFSCEPGKGSEPEVGFRAMLAAARHHDVWVLTSATGMPRLERFLSGHPAAGRITLVPLPVGVEDEGALGHPRFHSLYDRWQRRAGRVAVELERRIGFDVVHHVTLSSVWTRVGVTAIDKPLLWGPVGGGVEPPWRLAGELGAGGAVEAGARLVTRRAFLRFPPVRANGRRAARVLAQNPATARQVVTRAPVSVLSNATAVDPGHLEAGRPCGADVVFVGRMVPWKGTLLAVRTLRHVRHSRAVLRFLGGGPDAARVMRAAHRWGVAGRVRVEPWRPRADLLREIASAGALLHPSLHDEAGLAVAEALSLGTPVVALDHGGPREVARQWPAAPSWLVAPAGPEPTAMRLAEGVDAFLDDPPARPPGPLAPVTSFSDRLLAEYEAAAASSTREVGAR